jgi:23S rRNA (pseudouridine1915-N3)-methyltransferase
MKVLVRAIGKDHSKEYKSLAEEYIKRLPWKVKIEELVHNKGGSDDEIKKKEGELLLQKLDSSSFVIALDELGNKHSSKEFAAMIAKNSSKQVVFLIGGANGHSEEVRKRANVVTSLSDLTFPHMMVRLILIEQLYRAYTIQQGHPYHK